MKKRYRIVDNEKGKVYARHIPSLKEAEEQKSEILGGYIDQWREAQVGAAEPCEVPNLEIEEEW